MENKSRIGSTLIICGAACIVAALVFAGFLANALSNATSVVGPLVGSVSAIERQAGTFFGLIFLCVVAGIAFVVIGIVVGLRQRSQRGNTPSAPP
ncbi:MAG TPA: hypothetical protein VFI31_23230 [Pirellulales bacterium]|nr:hypothetical protein [Pirellulales bacterium]